MKLSALIFSIPAEALRMKGLVAPQSTAEIKIKINCIWYLKKQQQESAKLKKKGFEDRDSQ